MRGATAATCAIDFRQWMVTSQLSQSSDDYYYVLYIFLAFYLSSITALHIHVCTNLKLQTNSWIHM